MQENKCVAITGGHPSPALALIEAATKRGYSVLFFGRQYTFQNDASISFEQKMISKESNCTFIPIESIRLTKNSAFFSFFRQIFVTIQSIYTAFQILKKNRPSMTVSFGGYLAIPVVFASKLLGIPVYLHEQTSIPGRANKLLSKGADRIFTAFPQAQKEFPRKKTMLIGNPYASSFLNPKKPSWFPNTKKPILLVMGGSGGSHTINITIEKQLTQLLETYCVIHQTGTSSYKDEVRLGTIQQNDYYPFEHLLPTEIAYCMKHAKIAVTRTGANTFFLLIYYSLPSILIPLGIASNGEQQEQARIIGDCGAGIVLPENKLNELPTSINQLSQNYPLYKNAYNGLAEYKKLIISGESFAHEIGI